MLSSLLNVRKLSCVFLGEDKGLSCLWLWAGPWNHVWHMVLMLMEREKTGSRYSTSRGRSGCCTCDLMPPLHRPEELGPVILMRRLRSRGTLAWLRSHNWTLRLLFQAAELGCG